ncbi:MAG: DUF6020 family protein [Clostridia bacterium]|nr:DUF6020 family protein [Clostridia bacterium]
MPFLKKHAGVLSLLCVLLAAAAAPYLIPENPDSAVFRSGTLGALLLPACYFPVREALRRAGRRTLTAGAVFGLLFSLALALGSELRVYDGLLPGTGSLIRRLAVPLLAAPLLCGLCSRIILVRRPFSKAAVLRLPLATYAAVLLLCWLPVLLAYWPGMLNYDFATEFMQHVEANYSNIHPLLHSALMNGVIALGEALGSPTLGLVLMTLLQMALFALTLAYACVFAQRHGAPGWLLLAMTSFFGLHPVFSSMSMSMTKDTLFAAAVVTLSLLTWSLIEEPDAFLQSRKRCVLYILAVIGTALMRNNGVFALALLLPTTLAAVRGLRKKAAALCAAGVIAAAAVFGVLSLALSPSSLPSFQLYSLPAQQLVRAYNSGALSDADKAEIRSWYTAEEGLAVHPHLGDSAKGYLDRERLEEEGGQLLSLWAKIGKICPREYLEAFLMLNVGSWYPDDLSHSTIYPDVSYSDKGYLQTQEYDMSAYGLHTACLLPDVRDVYEQICRQNIYQKYPVIAILFCTATPFWAIILACAALAAKRQTRFLPAALGALGLWLSYLFGPCTLPRYTLPLFCLAPALLAAAFCRDIKED